MPRKPYTYHYIYKTTNLVNEKFYIGMHSTDDLEDGYVGSGTHLWHSIRKYGKKNFKLTILEFLPDRESLREREKEIVNVDLLKNPLCMNICKGGWGDRYGATFPDRKSSPHSEEHKRRISESNVGKISGVPKSEEHRKKLAEANLGKKQGEETKKKRSESLRKFWKENPEAEEAKQKKSESLKEAWKTRRGKPPEEIGLRESRKNSTT